MRSLTLLLAALGLLVTGCARSQEAVDPTVRRTTGKLVLGEAYVVVNARNDGRVEVGVSVGDTVLMLAFEENAAATWAASTAKLLSTVPRLRKGKSESHRSSVEEPETSGGGISFTRRIVGSSAEYHLFFADRSFGGFSIAVTRAEAQLLTKTIGDAAKTTRDLKRMTAESIPDSIR